MASLHIPEITPFEMENHIKKSKLWSHLRDVLHLGNRKKILQHSSRAKQVKTTKNVPEDKHFDLLVDSSYYEGSVSASSSSTDDDISVQSQGRQMNLPTHLRISSSAAALYAEYHADFNEKDTLSVAWSDDGSSWTSQTSSSENMTAELILTTECIIDDECAERENPDEILASWPSMTAESEYGSTSHKDSIRNNESSTFVPTERRSSNSLRGTKKMNKLGYEARNSPRSVESFNRKPHYKKSYNISFSRGAYLDDVCASVKIRNQEDCAQSEVTKKRGNLTADLASVSIGDEHSVASSVWSGVVEDDAEPSVEAFLLPSTASTNRSEIGTCSSKAEYYSLEPPPPKHSKIQKLEVVRCLLKDGRNLSFDDDEVESVYCTE